MLLPRLFHSLQMHAEQAPDQAALSWPGNTMTYTALLDLVEHFAAIIGEEDLEAGSAVVVDAKKSPLLISLVIALGRKGLSPLIVPARLGPQVRTQIIERAGVAYEASLDPCDRTFDIRPGPGRQTGLGGRHLSI